MKILTLLLASLLCFAAGDGIDFSQQLSGIDGKPLLNDAASKPDKPMYLTLGDVAIIALEAQLQEDAQATGAEKFKRDELARKIFGAKAVSLSIEELASIKERIGKAFPAVTVGAAWRLLDPAVTKPAAPVK